MDKVTRYEWHGNGFVLIGLCLLGITLPLAAVYFVTNILRIETEVSDGEKLMQYLRGEEATGDRWTRRLFNNLTS